MKTLFLILISIIFLGSGAHAKKPDGGQSSGGGMAPLEISAASSNSLVRERVAPPRHSRTFQFQISVSKCSENECQTTPEFIFQHQFLLDLETVHVIEPFSIKDRNFQAHIYYLNDQHPYSAAKPYQFSAWFSDGEHRSPQLSFQQPPLDEMKAQSVRMNVRIEEELFEVVMTVSSL